MATARTGPWAHVSMRRELASPCSRTRTHLHAPQIYPPVHPSDNSITARFRCEARPQARAASGETQVLSVRSAAASTGTSHPLTLHSVALGFELRQHDRHFGELLNDQTTVSTAREEYRSHNVIGEFKLESNVSAELCIHVTSVYRNQGCWSVRVTTLCCYFFKNHDGRTQGNLIFAPVLRTVQVVPEALLHGRIGSYTIPYQNLVSIADIVNHCQGSIA